MNRAYACCRCRCERELLAQVRAGIYLLTLAGIWTLKKNCHLFAVCKFNPQYFSQGWNDERFNCSSVSVSEHELVWFMPLRHTRAKCFENWDVRQNDIWSQLSLLMETKYSQNFAQDLALRSKYFNMQLDIRIPLMTATLILQWYKSCIRWEQWNFEN